MDEENTIQQMWNEITALRIKKNKDYGVSWKRMRPTSITDIIDVKVQRIRSFEENGHLHHEGVADSLYDIINYCLFRLLKLGELEEAKDISKYQKDGTFNPFVDGVLIKREEEK